jgi:hypothetical protein
MEGFSPVAGTPDTQWEDRFVSKPTKTGPTLLAACEAGNQQPIRRTTIEMNVSVFSRVSAPDPDIFPRPGPDPSPDPGSNPVPLPPEDPDPGLPLDPLPTPAPVY